MHETTPLAGLHYDGRVHIPKLWGYERIIVNNDLYCSKKLTVLPNGNACSIHYHKKKDETFFVTQGELLMEIYRPLPGFELRRDSGIPLTMSDFDRPIFKKLQQGSGPIRIRPYVAHRFWAKNVVCEFDETSTPDDPADSYRLVESGPIPK